MSIPNQTIAEHKLTIRQISAKGLVGNKNITWKLNDDVNILVGANGSGKSTLLNSVLSILRGGDGYSTLKNFSEIEILFSNEYTAKAIISNSPGQVQSAISLLKDLLKGANPEQTLDIAELLIGEEPILTSKQTQSLAVFNNYFVMDDQDQPYNPLQDLINIEYISTFDMKLMSKTEIDLLDKEDKTLLDVEIRKAVEKYRSFQIRLNNDIRKKSSIDAIPENPFKIIETFENTLNDFFNNSGKQIKTDLDGGIQIEKDNKKLDFRSLSSGEKQILLIMLKAVSSSTRQTIFIMDEPEISLHTDWQERLIKSIRGINQNCQVILATHSPGIVIGGWMDKYVDMKEIESLENN